LDQARENGERYIASEQTYRFLDDLVRDNEDVAVAALKDYLKYSMLSGVEGNEKLSSKKGDLNTKAKEKAGAQHDLDTALETAKKDCDTAGKLEEAVKAAKDAGVDTTKAEEDLKKAQDNKQQKEDAMKAMADKLGSASVDTLADLEKAVNAAKKMGGDTTEASEKIEALKVEKKLKGGEEDETSKKNREKKATHEKEQAAKAADKKKADQEKYEKERAEDKTKVVDAAGVQADADFSGLFTKAVDAVVDDMASEYKKSPFMKRQAAYAAFRELLAAKEAPYKITQNEMNKIFNVSEAESFNTFCKALGFDPDCVDAVTDKMDEKPEDDEKKDEKKEEKKD